MTDFHRVNPAVIVKITTDNKVITTSLSTFHKLIALFEHDLYSVKNISNAEQKLIKSCSTIPDTFSHSLNMILMLKQTITHELGTHDESHINTLAKSSSSTTLNLS
jgi:hypothetical protein